MTLRVERLTGHDCTSFTCGVESIDRWLVESADGATALGVRTFVLVDDTERVVGYFSIAPSVLGRDEAPRAIARATRSGIPAILLARLALDVSLHGRGLGAELLTTALTLIVGVARSVGGRVVIVDAIDDSAAAFYRAHDFTSLPGFEHRLIIKLSTAAKALELPWP